MPNSRKTEVLERLLLATAQQTQSRQVLEEPGFFDTSILEYRRESLDIWLEVEAAYKNAEERAKVPYSLAENPKLYALEPLVIMEPLVKAKKDRHTIARIFLIFYLIVHFFDDHVEHRDKFYSKFSFEEEGVADTQKGAAPFSFLLLSMQLIRESLDELSITLAEKSKIEQAVISKLLIQTRYFASERNRALLPEEVFEMKQRHVSGVSLSLLADIMAPVVKFNDAEQAAFEKGLIYLGSLSQITDDMRDVTIDAALRNANIVNVCARELGAEEGAHWLAKAYLEEERRVHEALADFYDHEYIKKLLSLPFYPFFIDKERLRDRIVD